MPLIRASKEYSIPARTLRRHRDKKVQTPGSVNLGRHVPALPAEVEHELHEHIKSMEKSLYGLTVRDVQRLVFDVAEHSGVQHPFNREKKELVKTGFADFLLDFGIGLYEVHKGQICHVLSVLTNRKCKNSLRYTSNYCKAGNIVLVKCGTWTKLGYPQFMNREKL